MRPSPLTAHDPRRHVEQCAAAITGTLRLATQLVTADRPIDLSGLDNEVGVLCAQALDLPLDQGVLVRSSLSTLATAADRLSQALQQRPAPPDG